MPPQPLECGPAEGTNDASAQIGHSIPPDKSHSKRRGEVPRFVLSRLSQILL